MFELLLRQAKIFQVQEVIHPNPFDGSGDGAMLLVQLQNDQETACESSEGYQIGVGPGDAIPGLSPHVTRIGIGYAPTENFSMFVDTEYNSNQFYRGDENNHMVKKYLDTSY